MSWECTSCGAEIETPFLGGGAVAWCKCGASDWIERKESKGCAYAECVRLDTERVVLGLIDSDGNESGEQYEYDLCPEHRDHFLHRVLTMKRPPADDWISA